MHTTHTRRSGMTRPTLLTSGSRIPSRSSGSGRSHRSLRADLSKSRIAGRSCQQNIHEKCTKAAFARDCFRHTEQTYSWNAWLYFCTQLHHKAHELTRLRFRKNSHVDTSRSSPAQLCIVISQIPVRDFRQDILLCRIFYAWKSSTGMA